MAEITTTTKKEFNVYAMADGTVEVTVFEKTTERDGRGERGRTSKEVARFTMTVREAAAMVGEVADGMAYGYKKMADGETDDSTW
jgi:hypothetical protein